MSIDIASYAKGRFTSKAYNPSKKLNNSQIQQIKDLLRFAPSSVNSQPWHFVLATSEQAKAKIAKSAENIHAKNVENIKNSALAIVFCIKTDIEDEYLKKLLLQEKKDGRFLNTEFEELQAVVRKKFIELHKYEYKDLLHWMEKQVYINLGNTWLGIAALGLPATRDG